MERPNGVPLIDTAPGPVWSEPTQALRVARRSRRRGWFTTPKWLVEKVRLLDPQAVSALCGKYRAPLRNYLQQRGASPEFAEDVTQGFFEGVVRRKDFRKLDPQGSLGAWLRLGAMRHLYNERAREAAQKRLLDARAQSELRAQLEQRGEPSPERLLDREQALRLIDRAWARLRCEYERLGNAALFDHLKGGSASESEPLSDAQLCKRLRVSKSYIGVARHQLKTREFPAALLAEYREQRARERASTSISQAATPTSVAEELRALLDALS